MVPPEIFSTQDQRTIIYMVSQFFFRFLPTTYILQYDINIRMNYEGLFNKTWWWKEQLCINYLVWFLGNIALRKSSMHMSVPTRLNTQYMTNSTLVSPVKMEYYKFSNKKKTWWAHGGISKIFFLDHFSSSIFGQKC